MLRVIPNIPQIRARWAHRASEIPDWLEVPMADGSHDTAEHQVLIFDECLVREACPDLLAEYRRWIGKDSLAYARERLGEMGERRIGACLKRFVP